jgi:thiol-disulfide isomerase/thioredoxin
MKKVFIILSATLFLLTAGKIEAQNSAVFTNDSIQISGRIIGFDPAQEEKFISFQTHGINGISTRKAIQVAADGSFSFTGYQPYKGNNIVSYRGAYISVYTSPQEPLLLTIDNAKINRAQHHEGAFHAAGKLAPLNNEFFAFQTATGYMQFDTLSNIGDKSQTDSMFAARRKKRLDIELAFLDQYAKQHGTNATLLNWLRNQYVYTAGFEIVLYPFFGKTNRTITIPQLLGFVDFVQLDNSPAFDNSNYYLFLKQLAFGQMIIVNINPSYKDEVTNKSFNAVSVYLDHSSALSSGMAGQIMALALYNQRGPMMTAANSIFDRFETIIQEPWLKKELLRQKADALAGFRPYDVAQRIRELKVSDSFKQRLLGILAKEKGNNIYLDFWGDWCGPCMMEMPNYPALITYMKDEPVKFIFMSTRMTEASMNDIQKKYGIKADFYNLTDEEVAIVNNAFQFQSYPAHFVVNREGKLSGALEMQLGKDGVAHRAGEIKKILGL